MRLSYTYTDGEHTRASDVPAGVQKGDVLDYTPRHIAQLQLGMESNSGWKSYLAASYALSHQAELYARMENIFDEQEITHRGSDGARGNIGRNGSVGLRLRF